MDNRVLGVVALATLAVPTTSGMAQTGACCVPDGNPICSIETPAACADLGGIYLGDDVPCEQQATPVRFVGPGMVLDLRAVTTCPATAPPCVEGPYHVDPWVTSGGLYDFRIVCPLPADFFAPGSDPFVGVVPLTGDPLGVIQLPEFPDPLDFGAADTIIRREADPFDRCDLPDPAEIQVPIEIVELSLVGIEPVVITYNGGQDPELWDLRMDLSGQQNPPGTMRATKEHCNGGLFDSDFGVCPTFTFIRQNDGRTVELDFCAQCDPGGIGLNMQQPAPWIADPGVNLQLVNPVCSDFHPGLEQTDPATECDCNTNDRRDKCDIEEGTSEDEDGDGIPDECSKCEPCEGDNDGDCDVDFQDVLRTLSAWGPCEDGVGPRRGDRTALAPADLGAGGGDLCWDNNIEPDGFNARALSPPAFPDIRVADDFEVPTGGIDFTDAHFGVVEDAGWVPGDVLEVTLYEQGQNDLPGDVLAVGAGPFERMATGEQLFDRDVYHYWIFFEPFPIESGKYWIGVRNPNGGGAGTNYWLTSDGGPNGAGSKTGAVSLDAGVTWTDEGPGWQHAFEITCDAPCVPCPEDTDGDCDVDFQDLLLVLSGWGPCR